VARKSGIASESIAGKSWDQSIESKLKLIVNNDLPGLSPLFAVVEFHFSPYLCDSCRKGMIEKTTQLHFQNIKKKNRK